MTKRLAPSLLAGASLLAIAANPAHAQTIAAPVSSATSQDQSVVEEIIVTGSRIARAGYSAPTPVTDRKSTRLNSSHSQISYAVFCLKKKKKINRCARVVELSGRAVM